MSDDLLLTKEAAPILGLHQNHVNRLCRENKIPAIKKWGMWWVRESDVLAYKECEQKPKGSAIRKPKPANKNSKKWRLVALRMPLSLYGEIEKAAGKRGNISATIRRLLWVALSIEQGEKQEDKPEVLILLSLARCCSCRRRIRAKNLTELQQINEQRHRADFRCISCWQKGVGP